MAKVKYIGTSNFREITAADWKSVGVEGQETAVWDRDDTRLRKGASQIVELNDAALAYLQESEKGAFEVVEDKPEEKPAGGKPKS